MGVFIRSQSDLKLPIGLNRLNFNIVEILYSYIFCRKKDFHPYRAFAALCSDDDFLRPSLIEK